MIHEDLKSDKDIIFQVIKKNNLDFILQEIPHKIFDDKDFLLKCFNQNPYLITIFPKLQNIKEFALKAVSIMSIPPLYKSLSDEMKRDKDVVIMAVKTDARILNYVDEELKNDRDILIAAFMGKENQPGLVSYGPTWVQRKADRFAELGNDIEKLLKEEDILKNHNDLNQMITNEKINSKKLKV